jgi:hypothetical protein
MNVTAVKQLIILVLCSIAAVLAGAFLASQNYENLLLLCYLLVGAFVLAAPGFVPLLAFGLINPFVLPIPFIYNVPFMLLVLGICCIKLFFRNAVKRESMEVYRHCFTWSCIAFFAWVALRYCQKPVFPNLSGFGANVTGFRAYLNYGICFLLVLLLPFFVTNRSHVAQLLRWMGGISAFFILLLTPFVFSKSFLAAFWLQKFGLYVTTFDNGWLRFVVLPGFGLNLLTLSFFPTLLPAAKQIRLGMGVLGLCGIIIGGNRSTLLMALVMMFLILIVHRRVMAFSVLFVGTTIMIGAFSYIGERMDVRQGVGFLRVLSVGSERIAYESGADQTVEWRMIRWKRAINEIQAHPILGKGYGGLENAWIFSDWAQFEEARVEVDLASGGIHNGYLTGAYSLGIPAVVFFLIAILGQIAKSFIALRTLNGTDRMMSDLHCLVLAHLVGLVLAIYIGTDLNNPILWIYLGLGALLARLKAEQTITAESTEAGSVAPPLFPRRLAV